MHDHAAGGPTIEHRTDARMVGFASETLLEELVHVARTLGLILDRDLDRSSNELWIHADFGGALVLPIEAGRPIATVGLARRRQGRSRRLGK
jgi:hypothetical protein